MYQLLLELFESFKTSYKSALLGAAFALTAVWGVAEMYGISFRELTTFIIEHQDQQLTLAKQLRDINDKVDDAEKSTHENHQEVMAIVQSIGSTEQQYADILQRSAENQDIVRALMEFGRIYASLVESGQHTPKTHQHLSSLYQALLDINADDPLDKFAAINTDENRERARNRGESVCVQSVETKRSPICKAKRRLVNIERSIDDFPTSARDDIEIEVLRYLSYCAARAGEINYQNIFTGKAEKIYQQKLKNLNQRMEPKLYRRKYYWIDYSQLVATVRTGGDNYETKAQVYFQRLRENLITESDFLRLKMVQHSSLVGDESKQKYWKQLIELAKPV